MTNGLPDMFPRLEPHQYFEVACCNGIANVAVARVSCMSVCEMCPRRLRPARRIQWFQRRLAQKCRKTYVHMSRSLSKVHLGDAGMLHFCYKTAGKPSSLSSSSSPPRFKISQAFQNSLQIADVPFTSCNPAPPRSI